jgi:hypothetical protein
MNLKRQCLILALLLQSSVSLVYAQTESNRSSDTEIAVLEENDLIPPGIEKIGQVTIGDNMRISCDYDRTIDQAKEKVRKMGGNVLKVTEHKRPNAWSTCHRIKGDVYRSSTPLKTTISEEDNKIASSLIADTAQYALLCLYRPGTFNGSALNVRVHVNGDLVSRMRNNSRQMVKLYKEEIVTVWAETEKRDEVELDIKFGEVYFVKAEIGMGLMVGRPQLTHIKFAERGYREFINTKRELTEGE